jgi:trehalose/maltose transport system substrate-binding protein
MVDVTWIGILSQHALNMQKTLDSQGYQYFDRILANNTIGTKLIAMPWFADAGLLYNRTDLLDKYEYTHPPSTWAELEEMAKTIQDGERASNPNFWGYVWQGAPYEGLTCDALEWQAGNGGGTILDEDGKVMVNNPQTIAAMDRAKGWVGTITPPGVVDFDEEEARFIWQAGNAAFMRSWLYPYALGQADDSPIKDKFDISIVPKGDDEHAHRASTLAGWQILTSRYSRAREASLEFVKYFTSRELQKSYAIELGRLPTITNLYDDPEVLSANPHFGRLHDLFFENAVARPSTGTASLYDEVSTLYFTAVNQILSGQSDAETAVAGLESALNDLLPTSP